MRGVRAVYIIDRFEGDWAVIEGEDRQTFRLPRRTLPKEAGEGDVIVIAVSVDRRASGRRRQQASRLLDGFFDR